MGRRLLQSLVIHPCNAPSLARVIDGKSDGIGGMVRGERVGRELRGEDTARLDVSSHDVIRSVPACCLPTQNSRASRVLWLFFARGSTSSNSRLVLGPEPRCGTKWSRRGSLRKVRQDVGKKFAFPQQLSGKLHVETWAGVVRASTWGFPKIRNSGEGVLWLGSLLGLRVSLLCYLGLAVTL